MTIHGSEPVGHITRAYPATCRVFERLRIDYCCKGKLSLAEACSARELELSRVIEELEQVKLGRSGLVAPSDDVAELVDYIEREHHAFTRTELARLVPLAAKVARVHGATHPEVVSVDRLVRELAEDLEPHMQKEERVLFPYIRSLVAGRPTPQCFPTILAPIRVMHMDHDRVGALLEELASVTRDYTPPGDACGSYLALYHGLAALQADIHQHVHLENNVLFPAAQQLEG